MSLRVPLPVTGTRAALDEEQLLVERLQAGEASAIADAYDAFSGPVRAFAKRLVGDDAAAEDLVQEVFLALPRAVRRFRGDSRLRTFVISVAVNHAKHFVRGAARRRAAVDRMAEEPLESIAPRASACPEHHAERRQLASVLTRALDDLPLDQRVAFVLCEVEERTAREAATIVGSPEATMRTRVFHAKRKLREALAREGVR